MESNSSYLSLFLQQHLFTFFCGQIMDLFTHDYLWFIKVPFWLKGHTHTGFTWSYCSYICLHGFMYLYFLQSGGGNHLCAVMAHYMVWPRAVRVQTHLETIRLFPVVTPTDAHLPRCYSKKTYSRGFMVHIEAQYCEITGLIDEKKWSSEMGGQRK